MIAYLDHNNRPLAGVPLHLLARKSDELINSWQSTWGIRALSVDGNGIVAADVTQASPQGVFAWLESIAAVCVDIEPHDIATFAGRSVASLAACDLLRADPTVRQGCSRLTLDEIMDTISELIRLALNTSQLVREVGDSVIEHTDDSIRHILEHERQREDQAAMERLRAAGFEIPPDIDLGPKAAPEVEYPEDYKPTAAVEIDPFTVIE